jgi:pilus assembly protein CpaF
MAVDIRTFVMQAHSLDELVALGTLPANVVRFLEASVAAGLNILVPGGTQAGKTTLVCWLS